MAQVRDARHAARARHLTVVVLIIWFVLALIGSLLGVFNSEPHPPILLGLAVVGPVALFALSNRVLPGFKQFVSSLNLRVLTWAQTWRVLGVVFLIVHQRGLLPGVFAFPAGWGDIAIGITAPVVAWFWRPPYPRKTFIVWNVLGIVDLVVAVGLGVLASPTPMGILAGNVTTRLMAMFPLSLIPTFLVPLFLVFHLICLSRVRRESLGRGV